MAIAMRWDEGSLRGTTRLKTLKSAAEKLGCADLFRRGCAVRLLRRRLTPPARRAADGVRNVCAVGRKLPARPAKPGDTNALWRAAALQTSWRKRGPNCPGLYAAGREPEGGGFRLGGLASAGAERVFTFVCAGYRGRAVGDWPRERRDGGAPGSVTALAAGEAALLARDRGARGSRAFPARGRERGYFTTDGRGLQRGNEAACGLPAASKKLRVFFKKRLTK